MIKENLTLTEIKKRVLGFSGERVNVRVDLGRNRSVKFTGKLTGVYPSVFTIEPDDKSYRGKTSYSYADVLCGDVRIGRG